MRAHPTDLRTLAAPRLVALVREPEHPWAARGFADLVPPEATVLPRYFGCSAREAREITAALLPRTDPPRREVVTVLPLPRRELPPMAPVLAPPEAAPEASAISAMVSPMVTPLSPSVTPLRAHEVEATHPSRTLGAEVEPLTASLRRLHVTVSTGFMEKLAMARTGLSHTTPHASMEQALEAALDLLLEKQARRKALVQRPRRTPTPTPAASPPTPSGVPPARRRGAPNPAKRPHVPADVEREVRLRDGDRCQFPLDRGGVCGSTWQVELETPILVTNHSEFFALTYSSSGLRVNGFLGRPRDRATRHPAVIWNRGGNRESWLADPRLLIAYVEAGYVAVASQYRGNGGSEGHEAFGGDDVEDVLNLVPLLKHQPDVDPTRIAMVGYSRGGMMTYRALREDDHGLTNHAAGQLDILEWLGQHLGMPPETYAGERLGPLVEAVLKQWPSD